MEAPVEEKGIAPAVVVDLVGRLAAIDLDDEVGLEAGEIADVGTDTMLATKLEAGELPVAQVVPEAVLGLGRRTSHRAGMVEHALKDEGWRQRVTGEA